MRPLAYAPPAAVACRLEDEPWLAWLDSETSGSPFARWSFLAVRPSSRLVVTRRGARLDGRPVGEPVPALLRRLAAATAPAAGAGAPFRGGWMGYLTYEIAEHFMPWVSPHLGDADATTAELGFYPAVLAWDHRERTCALVTVDGAEDLDGAAERLLLAHADALDNGDRGGAPPDWSMDDLAWTPAVERDAFIAAIGKVKDYIAQGDIYQANLAQAFLARLPDSAAPFEHYLMLRRANPAPFAAFLDFPSRAISSTSPERFLAVADGRVEARPIKGTIRCGADPEADRRARLQLETSEKERAENIMIVDLLRNDLSRVCRPHTVKTPQICALETYEGLHHLVSSVTGALKPGCGALDAIAAAFPGGSITGAPKLRAMEIIAELEPRARGVFCGGVGYIGVDGAADFNIAIRTVEYSRREARLHVGGGVTHLSDPEAEYEETLLKAERIMGRGSR
jgi:para-aminobenzoate synthetase component 1